MAGRWLKSILLALALAVGVCLVYLSYLTYKSYSDIKAGRLPPLIYKETIGQLPQIAPQTMAKLAAGDAPSLGAAKAKVTMVEFLDYDCPFSQATFGPLREVMDQYKDRVRLVIRDFPVEELHPDAKTAAWAAYCAGQQGKFWPMHDKLYINKDRHTVADMPPLGEQVGVDQAAFTQCLETQQTARDTHVDQDLRLGVSVGVEGTPTFFINNVKIQGALTKEELETLIKLFLAS